MGCQIVLSYVKIYNNAHFMRRWRMYKTMSKHKYYPEMDHLRAFAILMVLLYHSILVYPIDLTQLRWCKYLHTFLWNAEMPIFFAVAGFCWHYEGGYGNYLAKKAKHLLIPHFVFCIPDVLLRLIPNPLIHASYTSVGEALKDLFLYAGNDWFLWTLFMIFATAPLYKLVSKKKVGSVVFAVVVFLLYYLKKYAPTMFSILNYMEFLPFFFLGVWIRAYREKEEKPRKKAIIAVLFVIAAVLGAWLFHMLQHQDWMVPLLRPIIGDINIGYLIRCTMELGMACCFCYLFYVLAGLIREGSVHRGLASISKYSLPMYLLDGYALVLTRTVLAGKLGLTDPMLLIGLNFVFDFAIVYLISRFILAKFRWTRFLCGM